MTRDEIIAGVNEILIEGFEVEPGVLKPEADLREDLELDSLDAVDLVVALEKKFKFRIQEPDARAMKKLGDIYDYIEKRPGGRKEEKSE
ncbi:MAG: acyl carrier protein [Planctomycetota bacterium]|nr:MAG: acyl carrier protein [Planctomycetota bacterium]